MKPYTLASLALIPLASLACKSEPQASADFFDCENDARQTTRVLDAQSARGARFDATLHSAHFDEGVLNSLGRDKLDRMTRDNDSGFPLTLYLSAEGEAFTAREQSMRQHLLDAGLRPDQLRIVQGVNPNTYHPVAPGLARMSKTESGESQSSSEATSAPAANLGDLTQK